AERLPDSVESHFLRPSSAPIVEPSDGSLTMTRRSMEARPRGRRLRGRAREHAAPRAEGQVEIAVNESFVEPTVRAIARAARLDGGSPGDGKVLVLPLEECVRIRTGERGPEAI